MTPQGVDADRRRHDAARTGAHRERADVERELRTAVLTGDEPRHHPGVHRHGLVDDDREPYIGPRCHGPAAQNLDVRMPAAHQDEVALRDGSGHD